MRSGNVKSLSDVQYPPTVERLLIEICNSLNRTSVTLERIAEALEEIVSTSREEQSPWY